MNSILPSERFYYMLADTDELGEVYIIFSSSINPDVLGVGSLGEPLNTSTTALNGYIYSDDDLTAYDYGVRFYGMGTVSSSGDYNCYAWYAPYSSSGGSSGYSRLHINEVIETNMNISDSSILDSTVFAGATVILLALLLFVAVISRRVHK